MARYILWLLAAACFVLMGIGIIGLVSIGNCGCSDPNYVCAAKPCPDSFTGNFFLVFAGGFIAPILITVAAFVGRNARLRRYQSSAGPVSAEVATGPVAMPNPTSIWTNQRQWSTPPITPTATAGAGSQPFGGALGGFGMGSSGGPTTGGTMTESERLRQLSQLQSLKDSGAITQTEFDDQKRKILGES
jgi:hypothetical protein